MKKFTRFASVFTILILVFAGCPGGGDKLPDGNDDEDVAAKNAGLFNDKDRGDSALTQYPNNSVKTNAANFFARIYFDPLDKSFSFIDVDFTISDSSNLTFPALYGKYGEDGSAWSQDPWDTKWFEDGRNTIRLEPALFKTEWTSTGASAIDRKTINGILVQIASEDITFTLHGVKFIEVSNDTTPPPPPPPPPENIDVTDVVQFSTSARAAKSDLLELVNDGTDKAIKILPDGANKFKVKITLDDKGNPGASTKLVMDWKTVPPTTTMGWPGAGLGHENGYTWMFKDADGIGSPVSFNFVTDVPVWASGWGDAVVGSQVHEVEFEITSSAFQEFYLKNIRFE